MFCSMIWVTESSTVCASAPGYAALMATDGGAISGYCAIGKRVTDTAPVSMMMMATTQAKIGRSMKKRDILRTRSAAVACRRCDRNGDRRGSARRGFDGLDRHPRHDFLQPLDDHAIPRGQAIIDQPLIANAA